tara:strand:- start:30 stop:371 length:342 start_codon:yes stop_codon:yes gene_type:complete
MDQHIERVKYQNAYYKQLLGFTITNVIMEENMEYPQGDLWPSFILKDASGEKLEIRINQDPEGNGAGHIEFLNGQEPTSEKVKRTRAIVWRGTEIDGGDQIEFKPIDLEKEGE